MDRGRRYTHLRFIDRLWLVIPVLLAFVLLNLTPLREGDTWWHIKVGEEILSTKMIPEVDTFSFTASGIPFYFSRSWLSDVILFVISQLGRLPGLVLLQAIIGAITVGLSLSTSINRDAYIQFASIAVMIGFLGIYPFSTARPVMFSFLCFAIILWVLYSYRFQNHDRLWILPIVMVFWVNLNSAWLTGLFLIGLFSGLTIIDAVVNKYSFQEIRSLIFWSLLTGLVVLINPRGPGIIGDILTATGNPVNQIYVSEWQPTSITVLFAWPYFLILVLLFLGLAYSKNRLDWIEIVLVLAFIGLSLRYQRMLPFFYLLVIPTLAILGSGIKITGTSAAFHKRGQPGQESSRGNRWIFLAFGLLLIMIAVFSIPQVRLKLPEESETNLVDSYFPAGAADYLSSVGDQDLRIISQPEWGGYLTWRLYPKIRVFIDGRVEQFPLDVWEDYYQLFNGAPNWAEILDEHQIDYLILNKEEHQILISKLAETILDCPYEDSGSLVCKLN
jgi:hypothetical protein